MGIASFFRWVVARYPRALQAAVEEAPVTDQAALENGNYLDDNDYLHVDVSLPNPNGEEFSNLYFDLNGVVHMCTHPEDRPPPATEEDMFQDVFRYMDRIVALVRPRRLIYIAIDGVAPRAKINQQRTRRFRAAKEAREKTEEEEKLRALWREQGLRVPPKPKKPFDSNVITPGTLFMERLAVALRRYIRERIRSCPAWRSLVVILSDASVPGEGEHKIAEFIRTQRAQPGYDPETRHVLYGLDADLIMLALATHEPHFFILRERIYFDSRADKAIQAVKAMNAQQTPAGDRIDHKTGTSAGPGLPLPERPFDFFRIDRLREYLQAEFRDALQHDAVRQPREPLDVEIALDDFVFLCFFVGNDFLPHLPSLEIREGAIDFLLEVYKYKFQRIGHLTDGHGGIHFDRVRELLRDVAHVEDSVFRERARAAGEPPTPVSQHAAVVSGASTAAARTHTVPEESAKKESVSASTLSIKADAETPPSPGVHVDELDAGVSAPHRQKRHASEQHQKRAATEADPGLGLVPLPRKHVKENRATSLRDWKQLEHHRSEAAVSNEIDKIEAESSRITAAGGDAEQALQAHCEQVLASVAAPVVPSARDDDNDHDDDGVDGTRTAAAAAAESTGDSNRKRADGVRGKRRRIVEEDSEDASPLGHGTRQTSTLSPSASTDQCLACPDDANATDTIRTALGDHSKTSKKSGEGVDASLATGRLAAAEANTAASLETATLPAAAERHQSVTEASTETLSVPETFGEAPESDDTDDDDNEDDVLDEVLDHYTDAAGRQFEHILRERLKQRQTRPPTEEDPVRFHLPGWRERYYQSKFPHWPPLDTEAGAQALQRLCRAYYEGLLWVYRYYYAGCPSWGWFYPYHYAPLASDLAQCCVDQKDIVFERGAPFTPLEQLMAVLPASSGAQCLPRILYELMINPHSPIIEYYPTDFAIDYNGKRFAWQGVALLPFVDEQRLRLAIQSVLQDGRAADREHDPDKRRMLERADPTRAFGTAILFAHRDSELGLHLARVWTDATLSRIGLKLNRSVGNGVFGRVLPLNETPVGDQHQHEAQRCASDCTPDANDEHQERSVLQGIWTNAKHLPHVPQLLPGSKQPPSVLGDADLQALFAGRAGWKCARFGVLGHAAETWRRKRLAESAQTPNVPSVDTGMRAALSGTWSSAWPPVPENGTTMTWPWSTGAFPQASASSSSGAETASMQWWQQQQQQQQQQHAMPAFGAAASALMPQYNPSGFMPSYTAAMNGTIASGSAGYPASQDAILAAYYGYGNPWMPLDTRTTTTSNQAMSSGSVLPLGYGATVPTYSGWGAPHALGGIQGSLHQAPYASAWQPAVETQTATTRRSRPRRGRRPSTNNGGRQAP
jgi:5'-3' exonuclease